MTNFRFFLKNVATIVACFAVFSVAFTDMAMAQTFNYTDASGVTCAYTVGSNITFPDGSTTPTVSFANAIVDAPAGLTKWVVPETVVHNGVSYRLFDGVIHGAGYADGYVFANLTELVLPKYMRQFQSFSVGDDKQFPALRHVTFGEYYQYFGGEDFTNLPLETVTFKGTAIFYSLETGNTYGNQWQTFGGNPAETEIIIPCGTKDLFVLSLTNHPTYWNYLAYVHPTLWTADNFIEAECLNTLTVLSSDAALGNARSYGLSGGVITSTPDNTTAEFTGTAELLALPKAGVMFVGWDDDNTDNPRTVVVAEDVTYTAIFAVCNECEECEKCEECPGVTSAGEFGAASSVAIQAYPNPADNLLHVTLATSASGHLTLYDMAGKSVFTQSVTGTNAVLNIGSLASGSYILRLVENGVAGAGVKVIKN